MRPGSRVRIALFSGLALGIMALPTVNGSAQQPSAPSQQFRTTTDLVVLDVSVLDRNRRPVRGLTAADFTVVEDGAPQPIAAFQPVEAPEADIPSAKWMGRATLDVQDNETPDGRLVLIYLDERTESADPFFFQKAKKLGHAIVDQLAPNDVAAVAFVLDHRGAQEFTTDRGRLHQAIDTFAPSPYVDARVERTLTELARQFGAIPERRKVTMYIGSGEPFNLEVLTAMELVTAQAQPLGKSGVPPPPLDVPATLRTAQQRDLYEGLMTLTQAAQRANVSIYTFDPIGLTVESTSDAGADIETKARNDFLRMLAATTGGRAVVNHNAPEAEVPAVLRENSAYYLIGFRPADPKSEGRFHRIQVKVNRPNIEVRARRGFVEDRAGSMVAQSAPTARPGRILPASDVAVKLSAIPIGPDGQGSNDVALAISASLPSREVQGTEHVSIAYSILDMGGAEHASGRRSFVVTTPSGPGNGALVQTLVLEHLPPGRYDVRVSADAQERARRGELIGDVTVPDFRREALSASGVVIEESPAPNMVPTDALAGVLSGVPTLSRVFSSASHVEASLRLYQAAGGVPAGIKVTVSIIDGRDRVAFETTEVLDGSRFADGFALYKLPVPLLKLTPGPYLLRFDASRSSSPVVRREVQFEVR